MTIPWRARRISIGAGGILIIYFSTAAQGKIRNNNSKPRRPILNSSNYNKIFGASLGDDMDFEDFPDLNQPLPNISIHEQLRLASGNREIIASIQRNHQKRLENLWHSELIEKLAQE
uniref:IP20434p n=1 Tax=Drosophila melanogaster TaxID=7227 RepID=B3DMU7_DROME|nr:IP20434p [Drosophila melanogaster]